MVSSAMLEWTRYGGMDLEFGNSFSSRESHRTASHLASHRETKNKQQQQNSTDKIVELTTYDCCHPLLPGYNSAQLSRDS